MLTIDTQSQDRRGLAVPVPLGDFLAHLVVPRDITAEEVERLCAVLQTLPLEESAADPTEQCLIWSYEHDAWWRPNEAGYTTDSDSAGRFSRLVAQTICDAANAHVKVGEPLRVEPICEAFTNVIRRYSNGRAPVTTKLREAFARVPSGGEEGRRET